MKKNKKRSRKVIISVLTVVLALIFTALVFIIKLTSSYYHTEERCLYVNSNTFSFNCPEDYNYIHLELSSKNENPVKYNIINPAGQIVKTAELVPSNGDNDFFCDSKKGMWKVAFDVNAEVKVDYKLWEGNLKFTDPLSK